MFILPKKPYLALATKKNYFVLICVGLSPQWNFNSKLKILIQWDSLNCFLGYVKQTSHTCLNYIASKILILGGECVYVCFSFSATYLAKMKHGKSCKEHTKKDLLRTAEGYAAFHNFWRHHSRWHLFHCILPGYVLKLWIVGDWGRYFQRKLNFQCKDHWGPRTFTFLSFALWKFNWIRIE